MDQPQFQTIQQQGFQQRYQQPAMQQRSYTQPQASQAPQNPAASPKKKVVIQSIDIWSMAKFQGLVNTVVGIVMGAIYLIVGMLIEGIVPLFTGGAEATNSTVAATVGVGVGTNYYLGALLAPSTTVFIFIILGSALLGFISGALLAIFYNIISVIVGGIEIELKAK